MKSRRSIREWADEDKPRERMLSLGSEALSNSELLAILIGSGNQKESAVDLSRRILADVGDNLHELGKLGVAELTQKYEGVGPAKAVSIIAALELGKRRKLSDVANRKQITSSSDAVDILHPLLSDLKHEEFWVLLLSQSNKLLQKVKISQGGLAATSVDVRVIMKHALDKYACSMILSHNHPSGNQKPSEADISLTNKIKNAAEIFNIRLIDHVIICQEKYYSFADDGLL